jgi:hypothetical protein
MNERTDTNDLDSGQQDPLGLGDLPQIDPPGDGWAAIEAALRVDRRSRRRQRLLGGFAVAASLIAVISIVLLRSPAGPAGPGEINPGFEVAGTNEPTDDTEPSTSQQEPGTTVAELVAMSQLLEQRLRHLRDDTAAMPAESVIYVTELEDLVARVDHELSVSPESVELWSQRVNLLLDLEALFQHQFETEYGRMASL